MLSQNLRLYASGQVATINIHSSGSLNNKHRSPRSECQHCQVPGGVLSLVCRGPSYHIFTCMITSRDSSIISLSLLLITSWGLPLMTSSPPPRPYLLTPSHRGFRLQLLYFWGDSNMQSIGQSINQNKCSSNTVQVQESSDCSVCMLVHLVCFCGCHNIRLNYFFLFRIFKCYIGWKITCWFRVFTITHCAGVLKMLWNIMGHKRYNLNKALLKVDRNAKNSHKIISHELWRWHEIFKMI